MRAQNCATSFRATVTLRSQKGNIARAVRCCAGNSTRGVAGNSGQSGNRGRSEGEEMKPTKKSVLWLWVAVFTLIILLILTSRYVNSN
jgi:hypothetical protein